MKKKVRVTFETDCDKNTIECDGIAGVSFAREPDGHENQIILVGSMSVEDMISLHEVVEKELLRLLKKEVVKDFNSHRNSGVSLEAILDALLS
jgi:hypothetical protein